jgi:hypothetical protein
VVICVLSDCTTLYNTTLLSWTMLETSLGVSPRIYHVNKKLKTNFYLLNGI